MDLTQFAVVGKCPVDGAPVHETPSGYVCENFSRGEGAKCGFRLSRTLLGATVPREQFQKLVENKKTDLIKGFKSKRTGRFFEAFLVLKDEGKIGFEFMPRKPRVGGKGAKGKAAADAPGRDFHRNGSSPAAEQGQHAAGGARDHTAQEPNPAAAGAGGVGFMRPALTV